MNIYHYDRSTGEYIGQGVADLDPLEGKPMVPAHATVDVPPPVRKGFANVYNAGVWVQVPDNRGKIYDTLTGEGEIWQRLGAIPPDKTALAPPSSDYSWNGKAWVLDLVKSWERVRQKRDGLLASSDWTQIKDAPLTAAQSAKWSVYRQALRDVPAQADPLAVVWPVLVV